MRSNEFSTADLTTGAFTLGGQAVQTQTAPAVLFLKNAKKKASELPPKQPPTQTQQLQLCVL